MSVRNIFLVLGIWLSGSLEVFSCQLSLLGSITQQPLTYNPFQAGAAVAPVTFTLKNADKTPCTAAFAFFRPGRPQATSASGSLSYTLVSSSGPLIRNEPAPPASLSGSGSVAYISIGANQSYTANAVLSIDQGQIVAPGTYSDTLYLGVYQSVNGGSYAKSPFSYVPLNITVGVNAQVTLSIAGGGQQTTLNFGELIEGATRSVLLQSYSNQRFRLTLSSYNSGIMKPIDTQAITEGVWRVPYTVAINGLAPVSLSQERVVSVLTGVTQSSGISIPIAVQIGSLSGQRAGVYRDVITVSINAVP